MSLSHDETVCVRKENGEQCQVFAEKRKSVLWGCLREIVGITCVRGCVMEMSADHAKWLVGNLESSACPLVIILVHAHATHQQVASRRSHARLCTTTPTGRQYSALKCNNDCAIAQRNARLADALGITAESREKAMAAVYHVDITAFGRANPKFVALVEKAFEDFVTSQKKTQMLPPMPPEKRKFVQDLAAVYRIDTQMVDQEPNRSVRLLRRLDTRTPTPLLSVALATSAPAAPSLGKLADLRTVSSPSWRVNPTPPPKSTGAAGWGPRPTAASPAPSIAPEPSRLAASANVTRTPSPVHLQQCAGSPLADSLIRKTGTELNYGGDDRVRTTGMPYQT
ncbi:hypothetical protein H0H92_000107 [Tricholoma furcatifolium]|nr:hypothetical protein H0H92_000107 [Tricholoma furcatifolium]